MKYELMIRSRPCGDILEKHERLIRFLLSLKNDWGLIEGVELPQIKDPGTLPMEQVNLSKCFRKGIKALVSYQNRKYYRDEGKFDDYFKLEFNPAKFDYALLAMDVFEKYVREFQPYRGHVGDQEFVQLDFEKSIRVEAARSGVYRIYPICFFDKELCARSFHLTPEEISTRVAGLVEKTILVSNGVLIIASSKILTIEEADAINERLQSQWV